MAESRFPVGRFLLVVIVSLVLCVVALAVFGSFGDLGPGELLLWLVASILFVGFVSRAFIRSARANKRAATDSSVLGA